MYDDFKLIILQNQSNIAIQGELNIFTVKYLKEYLSNKMDLFEKDIVIDCEELLYIDSCGINVLEWALKNLDRKGLKIQLINLTRSLKKLFTITNLESTFQIES